MFLPSAEPPLLSEAGLQSMCFSLNNPIVHLEGLPVGPARAAVALYTGEYGELRLAVGVRSLSSRALLVYSFGGDLNELTSAATALDSALNFGEGMGFLFGEDVVQRGGPAGRLRALRGWQELIGLAEEPDDAPAPREAAPERLPEPRPLAIPEGEDDGELLLDDLAEADLARGRRRPARPPAEPPLTKFRRPAEKVPARSARRGERSGGGSELGRIPLVRRRLGAEVPPKPSWLLRLLGSF
jgi:hypothetical protein